MMQFYAPVLSLPMIQITTSVIGVQGQGFEIHQFKALSEFPTHVWLNPSTMKLLLVASNDYNMTQVAVEV